MIGNNWLAEAMRRSSELYERMDPVIKYQIALAMGKLEDDKETDPCESPSS